MKPFRLERVAEVVRRVVSQTVLLELNDPRIRHVTITRAEVTPDLQHARVYVSIMGSEQEQRECLEALRKARGYIQHKLAQQLTTRYIPTLQFRLDKGVKNSFEVAAILRREQEAQEKSAAPAPPSASEVVAQPCRSEGSDVQEGASPPSSRE
ncbi:MAG: 30S ribosome-binding factor RbfA [Gemmatales bacterium]|nr:30S ribosome-binding factor RbfA [Gemmatales bacterium]MCS7160069.1 30S ribosome-binding factor RbfA [Gemmatales bacterium]MDW8175269.1 30S ribosome-binding factor RbfA [Gemmatales bacterium]MDW8223879.1 30S ribosome-binding factor RbfA [Gemmatales bacterium]